MTELNFQELAKQGHPQAIASWLNSQLPSEGIAASANLDGDCLDVILEAEQVPIEDTLVDFVREKLTDLQPNSIRKVKVEGRESGKIAAAWSQEFSLESTILEPQSFAGESVPNLAVANMDDRTEGESTNMDEEKSPELAAFENRLRSTFIVVGLVTGLLAIAVVAFVSKMLNEPPATTGKNPDETANVATVPDTFREAVNSAVKAAELGRSAKTKEDWTIVADRWQEAVSLMRRVPVSSANHELAQTKVIEYQKYLLYAQESAVNPPPLEPTPATAVKANSKKANSEKAEPEKATSKKANPEKESSEKPNPKKANSEKAEPEKATPSR
jgi:cell division septation protein DedD